MNTSNEKNLNIFLMGLAFMLLFTAFYTMSNIQTTILKSSQDPASAGYVADLNISGYTSLSIIYTGFAASNWIGLILLPILGAKVTFIIGGLTYAAFIAQFLYLSDNLIYGTSALVGIGAGLIWTAQGHFLTINSEPETIARNSGIFWTMFQSSMFMGNTFVFFQFQGKEDFDAHTRNLVVIVLLVTCMTGVTVFLALRPTPWVQTGTNSNSGPSNSHLMVLKNAWSMFWTFDMVLLSIVFFYVGLEETFWSGVYGPCIGFTLAFGKGAAKSLVGLHGIFVGVGEITGGFLLSIFGHLTTRLGHYMIVILGLLTHSFAYFLILINLPNDSPFGNTLGHTIINSSSILAMVASYLLGFGDACYCTQISALLGSKFPKQSAAAFVLFRFLQAFGSAVAFFYSRQLGLYSHLLILSAFCVAGTLAFALVELVTRKKRNFLEEHHNIKSEHFQSFANEQSGGS